MKLTITKMLAGGEQLIAELSDAEALDPGARKSAFAVLDERLREMNLRVLSMNKLYPEVVKRHPRVALLVNDIIQTLTGEKVFETTLVEQAVAAANRELPDGGEATA